jgi:DNA replication protein DnaC
MKRFSELTPEEREEHSERVAKLEQERAERKEQARRSELHRRLAKQLGARYAPERVALDTFQIYDPKQRDYINKLRGLDLERMTKDGHGLIFYGPVGGGKDRCLAAMLYHAVERGFDCHWLSGQRFYGDVRDLMDSKQPEAPFFAGLANPMILAISDLAPPEGDLSVWNLAALYRLVDERYRELKPTWLTLNVETEAEAYQVLSAPTYDRLREGAMVLPFFWKSHRERVQL